MRIFNTYRRRIAIVIDMGTNKVTAQAEPTMTQPLLSDALAAVHYLLLHSWEGREDEVLPMLLDCFAAPQPHIALQNTAEHMLMETIEEGDTETAVAFITPHIDSKNCICYICQSE